MKLNTDCIRAVLLEIEKSWELKDDNCQNIRMESLNIDSLYHALPEYDKKDIFYSLYNLDQAGYVDVSILWADGGTVYNCAINHMTYKGHQFLDQIRDTTRWSKIKRGIDAVRNYSLAAISAMAEGITSAAIASYLKSES